MKVKALKVYGLKNSFRVSHFPKSVAVYKCSNEFTDTIKKLGSAERGSGHDNFLKGIVVQFDLTCTIKMWTEAERYHWFDIVSSQSTMSKIADMDPRLFLNKHVAPQIAEVIYDLQRKYKNNPTTGNYLNLLYSCPVGLELTAGITTNYQQLKTIYAQRKHHKLPEWREFCDMIEQLPYMNDFLKLEDKVCEK